MKTLYFEAKRRERKIVRLYEKERLLDEIVTGGDFLLAVKALLRRNKVSLKEIREIKAAPSLVDSTSNRVALSIAQALRYALGLWSPTGGV